MLTILCIFFLAKPFKRFIFIDTVNLFHSFVNFTLYLKEEHHVGKSK